MSTSGAAVATEKEANRKRLGELVWRWGIPIAISVALVSIHPPTGLTQHAWNFFALFAGMLIREWLIRRKKTVPEG